MDFADFDPMAQQRTNGVVWLFKFHRQVTRVIIYSQVFEKARIVRMFRAETVKKMNHLAAGLQQTNRFRLKTQMEFSASLSAEPGDVLDTLPKIDTDHFQLF